MIRFTVCALLISFAVAQDLDPECTIKKDFSESQKTWKTLSDDCAKMFRAQVQNEVDNAIIYLSMASYFSRETVDRPGFAEFFFDSASEERDHAMKFMEYAIMRGEMDDTIEFESLIKPRLKDSSPENNRTEWGTGLNALNEALKLEALVTKDIKQIARVCEKSGNQYHAVDYIINEFLDEQYKGQKKIADMISILHRMTDEHGELGEFIFDKKLLKGEVV